MWVVAVCMGGCNVCGWLQCGWVVIVSVDGIVSVWVVAVCVGGYSECVGGGRSLVIAHGGGGKYR